MAQENNFFYDTQAKAMRINRSGATFSSIVGIGARVKQLSESTGQEYLFLNRGINAVCTIDLSSVIQHIDMNSTRVQVYPPNAGMPELREAINDEYFSGGTHINNIAITAGGMAAIDLVVQTLHLDKLYYAQYFWGSYAKLATIRAIPSESYSSLQDLAAQHSNSSSEQVAVLVCDPNNPVGNKQDDEQLLADIRALSDSGVIVIFDSPYRRLFCGREDTLFRKLLQIENVIITESFSKSLGLSGQRLGFIHSTNSAFMEELGIRLLYSANGVNAFAQVLVHALLSTDEGQRAVEEFKQRTVEDIRLNIAYLREHGLLVDALYHSTAPVGIFAVVKIPEHELLEHRIGSVSMKYFTHDKDETAQQTSRICVSVQHRTFVRFFTPVVSERTECAHAA